jgi:dihydroxyacetone kinase-like protein
MRVDPLNRTEDDPMVAPLSTRLVAMFHAISESIEREKDQLSELDGAIGDADHGITMSIGFHAVNSALSKRDTGAMSPSEILNAAASAFLNAVGASTGPLYATGFKRAAQALADSTDATLQSQAAIINAIATGIKERGKGQRGDKTMLDAWIPAAESANDARRRSLGLEETWKGIVAAGEAGANATCSMIAARGRAARLGERALGHLDPGAASAVLVLKAMAQVFCQRPDASPHLVSVAETSDSKARSPHGR